MQENNSHHSSNSGPIQTDGRRIFFALPIEEAVRDQLARFASNLRKAAQFTAAELKWVSPENYHVTLHFLGSTPEDQVQRLISALPLAVEGLVPFDFGLRGIGYFPHPRAPKVLWAGVEKNPDELNSLVTVLAEAISAQGIQLKHDNFHAHVTLARFKRLKGTAAFVRQARLQPNATFGTSRANRVHLMESDLRRSGPIYQIIGEGELRGAR